MKGYLLEGEKQDHTTLDNLREGFQLIGYDWRYLYVNEAIVRQSEYTRKELLGSTMMERYPGIEDTAMFDTLKTCMRERCSDKFENEHTFPDRSKAWFELRIQPVKEGLFVLSVDITERKHIELERKAYLKGLEELIFMTSHKLRQPITNLAGLLTLIEDAVRSPSELKKTLHFMQQSIQDLDNFTEELTAFINELKKSTKQHKH